MDRLSSKLRKGGAAAVAATTKHGVAPFIGKFKLHTSTDSLPPLPLLTKKRSSLETKPKAKFLKPAAASSSTEKPKNAMSSAYGTSRFTQPLKVDHSSKKSSGFSLLKLPSQSKELGTLTKAPFVKGATALSLSSTKPLLNKVSAQILAKKNVRRANEADKAPLFKLQAKGGLPFTFRADTKSSAAKKRKATEAVAVKDGTDLLFCKTKRDRSSITGPTLKSTAFSKDKDGDKQFGVGTAKNIGQKDGNRTSISSAMKMGDTDGMGVKVDDGAVLRKRRLLLASSRAGPALKKSKRTSQTVVAVQPLQDTKVAESGRPFDACRSVDPSKVATKLEEAPSASACPMNSTLSTAEALPSPLEDGTEEDLAMKLLCIVDDDKEDEFLIRAAAVQEFTDRVGLEQKQIRNRLLDVHANISESLLDALTDLMAEEGGIGIDKLACDMNIDVDIGHDVFLRDDEIQVFL
uniref:Calmodulin n=1 Tax=Peronospora matthiolae TaxID=2874970 RepID=A0AAV1TIE4_9STRA